MTILKDPISEIAIVENTAAPMSAEIARRVVEAFHQPIKSPEAEAGTSSAFPNPSNPSTPPS